jgi:hypothetical protein
MSLPLQISSTDQALQAIPAPKTEREKIFVPLAKSIGTTNIVKDDLSLQAFLFLNSPYRYHWYCAGVGTGKSYVLARYMLQRVMTNWETVGLVASNTFTQLTQSTLPHFFTLLDYSGLEYVVDKRPPAKWKSRNLFKKSYENVISIKIGVGKVAHILTRTLESWKAIRGVTIGWAGLDEIADTRPEAWAEITERLRCDLSHALQIRVVGMPALPGNNWTWQEFSKGDPNLYRVTFQSSTEARHLKWDEYLLPLLQRLDPIKALQRIYARIVIDQTGKVYYCYRDQINNVRKYAYDPNKIIFLCWDFNILSNAPISAVLFQEHWNADNKCWDVQVFDEIVIHGATTVDACYEFLKRYEHQHRADVWIFGDVTSNLNRTTTEFAHIKKTLYPSLQKRLKMVQLNDKSNPRIAYRVAATNALLRNALGVVRLYFCPDKCKETIQDMLELKPKDGKIAKEDDARSHCSDALGYGLCIRHPPYKRSEQKQVRGNI